MVTCVVGGERGVRARMGEFELGRLPREALEKIFDKIENRTLLREVGRYRSGQVPPGGFPARGGCELLDTFGAHLDEGGGELGNRVLLCSARFVRADHTLLFGPKCLRAGLVSKDIRLSVQEYLLRSLPRWRELSKLTRFRSSEQAEVVSSALSLLVDVLIWPMDLFVPPPYGDHGEPSEIILSILSAIGRSEVLRALHITNFKSSDISCLIPEGLLDRIERLHLSYGSLDEYDALALAKPRGRLRELTLDHCDLCGGGACRQCRSSGGRGAMCW